MFLPRLSLAVMLSTALVSAQIGRENLTRRVETPLPTIGQPLSLAEQFRNQLRLDANTQIPAVEEILVGASKEAAPVAQQMFQLRQQLVNAELRNEPEAGKAVLAQYQAASAAMAAIEAQAFSKIYALLRPNQQSRAPQAFAIMAGIFLPPAPPTRPAARGGAPARGGR